MIEPEMAYADLDDLMRLVENFISHIVMRVLEGHQADLKVIGKDVTKLETIKAPFPRVSYDEAHAMLEDAFAKGLIENRHTYGDDFGSPDETYISNQFDRPVIVHRYPAAVKAFYMEPDAKDPTKALCMDVLAPEGYGEIVGGSQRVASYDLLKSRIEAHGLPLEAFPVVSGPAEVWQCAACRVWHGIERVVAWVCGLDHVRETIPFARTLNRIYP